MQRYTYTHKYLGSLCMYTHTHTHTTNQFKRILMPSKQATL